MLDGGEATVAEGEQRASTTVQLKRLVNHGGGGVQFGIGAVDRIDEVVRPGVTLDPSDLYYEQWTVLDTTLCRRPIRFGEGGPSQSAVHGRPSPTNCRSAGSACASSLGTLAGTYTPTGEGKFFFTMMAASPSWNAT